MSTLVTSPGEAIQVSLTSCKCNIMAAAPDTPPLEIVPTDPKIGAIMHSDAFTTLSAICFGIHLSDGGHGSAYHATINGHECVVKSVIAHPFPTSHFIPIPTPI